MVAQQTLFQYEIDIADTLKEVKIGSITRVKRRLKNMKLGIESDFSLVTSYNHSINKYLVELHKKFSIPFASIIFILIGAPLGMMAKKGGFAVSMAFSLGFFIVYWIFLIGGEEFADRGLLSPALSMWIPNWVLGLLGIFMCYWQSLELRTINLDLFNIFKRRNGKIQ
jgi:lipopolysaccharide export system permease protein